MGDTALLGGCTFGSSWGCGKAVPSMSKPVSSGEGEGRRNSEESQPSIRDHTVTRGPRLHNWVPASVTEQSRNGLWHRREVRQFFPSLPLDSGLVPGMTFRRCLPSRVAGGGSVGEPLPEPVTLGGHRLMRLRFAPGLVVQEHRPHRPDQEVIDRHQGDLAPIRIVFDQTLVLGFDPR